MPISHPKLLFGVLLAPGVALTTMFGYRAISTLEFRTTADLVP